MALSASSLGQDGVDLVGAGASPGPDGVQDLHLHLRAGLTGGAISSIVVQGPAGFEWVYGANPEGAADAEFFASAGGQQGDLYLNPTVQSDLNAQGGPLGSSTGALITLPSGSTLTLTVNYQGGPTATDTGSVTVMNLASPPTAMPEPGTPANAVMGDFAVTSLGQDGTSAPGDVHLRVTGLAGRVISSATLSDAAGSFWSQLDTSGLHTLDVVEAGNDQSADMYFAPTRNETLVAVGESAATDMTLRLTFSADPLGAGTEHVVQFAGGAWQPGLVATPLNGRSVSGVSTQAALLAALDATGAGEVDTIGLAPGATIVLTGPLQITHSVRIVGDGASLVFTQGSAPWSGSASGAIYVANPGITDISVDLEDFTVRFALSAPLEWYAQAGSTTLFDPESSGYGQKAVINTSVGNDGRNRETLTLAGMTVLGPPDFDAAPPTPPDSSHSYAGEPEIPLIEAGDDDGSIAGSTFRGGSIQLAGGPWTVTGNTDLGALAGSYSPSAFSLVTPHDVTLTSNHVFQAAAGGTTFRLVNLAESGYDDTIVGNTFIGGQVGDEVTYVKTSATSGDYEGINDSEVILAEPKDFLFEGSPAAVSADGRTLVLPMASASVASRAFTDASTGPGLIVSIVDASSPLAGTYYRVAQQVSGSPLTFLMQDPLPAGNYVISVVAGFVGDTIADNALDLAGKSSTGIVLNGSDFGTSVASNTIQGGETYSYPYTGTGILVESGVVSNDESAAGAPFPVGYGWSHYPTLGVTVADNTVIDSIGNLVVEVLHGPGLGADAGRRYLTATVTDNTFSWQQSYLTAWSAAFLAITNGNGNPANLATDPSLPPAVTIGSGFSANGGFRSPWNSGVPGGLRRPGHGGRDPRRQHGPRVPASGVPTPSREGGAGLRRHDRRRSLWRDSPGRAGRGGPRGRPVALRAPERQQPRDWPGRGRSGIELHDGRDRRRRLGEPRRPRRQLLGLGTRTRLGRRDVRSGPRGRRDLGRRPDDRGTRGPRFDTIALTGRRSSARRRRARSS